MEETVSATEANRDFSRILRGVREGTTYIVTSHDRPVARISPVVEPPRVPARVRAAAHAALMEHHRSQPVMDIGPWTRDELYDDEL